MKPKKYAEKLFDEVNILIPIDANINDTGKEAYEKMKTDHVATKKICFLIIEKINNALGEETCYFHKVKEEIEKL